MFLLFSIFFQLQLKLTKTKKHNHFLSAHFLLKAGVVRKSWGKYDHIIIGKVVSWCPTLPKHLMAVVSRCLLSYCGPLICHNKVLSWLVALAAGDATSVVSVIRCFDAVCGLPLAFILLLFVLYHILIYYACIFYGNIWSTRWYHYACNNWMELW